MSDEQLTSPGAARGGATGCAGAPEPPTVLPPDDALAQAASGRTLPATRPPESFVPVRRWVVEVPAALRTLRSDLRDQLAASVPQAVDDDALPDNVVLVTSELATNALAHGRPPAHVELLVDGPAVLVVVSDCDTRYAPFVAADREPGEGGFGLQIARRLSSEVGWWTDASGKHVWAAFPAEPVA